MDSFNDIERIARHRISERTAPTRIVPQAPRRTRLASALRRVADRIDG
jgi:hypothetical protein